MIEKITVQKKKIFFSGLRYYWCKKIFRITVLLLQKNFQDYGIFGAKIFQDYGINSAKKIFQDYGIIGSSEE